MTPEDSHIEIVKEILPDVRSLFVYFHKVLQARLQAGSNFTSLFQVLKTLSSKRIR